MINYIKGDLFQVVKQTNKPYLVHACNCLGIWGGGIALQFRKRYNSAYNVYQKHCEDHSIEQLLGSSLIIEEKDCSIVCLFTSIDGGESVSDIVNYTKLSIADLQKKVPAKQEIYMPKINSGIFGVPWEYTEKVLVDSKMNIVVYEY